MNLLSVFQKKNSGEIARSRLKILLASDKLNCSPDIMEMIKDDMIHMISKYMEMCIRDRSCGEDDYGAQSSQRRSGAQQR